MPATTTTSPASSHAATASASPPTLPAQPLPGTLQRIYAVLGEDAVLIPIRYGEKIPSRVGWPTLPASWARDQRNWPELLSGNIGVRLGSTAGGICTIDFDDDRWISAFLEENPRFKNTLMTRGARGCNFWFRTVPIVAGGVRRINWMNQDERGVPKVELVGEWRADGGQTVIHGIHPKTKQPYQWLNSNPIISCKITDIELPYGCNLSERSSQMSPGVEEISPLDDTSLLGALREEASEVLGEIRWQHPNIGYVTCPGENYHTNANGPRDCRVVITSLGGYFHCLHESCKDQPEYVEMQNQLGAALRTVIAASEDAVLEIVNGSAATTCEVAPGEPLNGKVHPRDRIAPGEVEAPVGSPNIPAAAERHQEAPVASNGAPAAASRCELNARCELNNPDVTTISNYSTAAQRSKLPPATLDGSTGSPETSKPAKAPLWWQDPVNGIHFDGRCFWVKTPAGPWVNYDESAVVRMLKLNGISSATPKGVAYSPMDVAINHIQTKQRIAGALSMCYHPSKVTFNGRIYLNTCTQVPVKAYKEAGPWGATGRFPWISRIWDTLGSEEQKEHFLGWCWRAYVSAVYCKPSMGQAVFLAGKRQSGKTLLNRKVIGGLLGGYSDPAQHLTNSKQFTKGLFDSPLLALDDAVSSSDPKKKIVYTETIKKLVANPSLTHEAKFHDEFEAQWKGRIIVTMNDDANSIQGLPELNESILDKVHLFQMKDDLVNQFPANIEEIIQEELPHFAAWLLNWNPPARILGDGRYGIKAFHDPGLVNLATNNSETSDFGEHLEKFLDAYQTDEARKGKMFKDKVWLGNQTELKLLIINDDEFHELFKNYLNRMFYKQLLKLSQKSWSTKYKLEYRESCHGKPWAIIALT